MNNENNIESPDSYTCPVTKEQCDADCPHCAYEYQQLYEEELEREAAIDFAKWVAKDFMSIWVEDKWMWECINEQNELYIKYGYLTEEQLYELYLKS
jgi:hypothetical protein